jgi:hypothetical protein
MSQNVILFNNGTGVSLMIPAESSVDECLKNDVPKGAKYIVIDRDEMPSYIFQDAWSIKNDKISIDMNKARDVHRSFLRIGREPKLKELDIKFQIALEKGEDLKPITSAKQALRDLTIDPAIEAAETTDDLVSIWPELDPNPYINYK